MAIFDLFGKKKKEELKRAAEAEEMRKQQEAAAKRKEAKAKKAEETAKLQGKKKAKAIENPAKIAANAAGEPWVAVLGIDVDKDDPGMGAFELDWNDIFVARLVKAGYQGKTDQDIVDNWFQAVCRNVVLETYQQEQADPANRASNRRDLGNGRTEIS
jgi:regulator of protease activity HflC (stomatin/prohibitin superfamily)